MAAKSSAISSLVSGRVSRRRPSSWAGPAAAAATRAAAAGALGAFPVASDLDASGAEVPGAQYRVVEADGVGRDFREFPTGSDCGQDIDRMEKVHLPALCNWIRGIAC
jgi:hypothetical protein